MNPSGAEGLLHERTETAWSTDWSTDSSTRGPDPGDADARRHRKTIDTHIALFAGNGEILGGAVGAQRSAAERPGRDGAQPGAGVRV
ncbi:hypothetical protein GCM10009544_54280 [Streptomyces stramineus]|uniref:Uncharacterized protein n=1 Tax=Streptomyces stramineus TaxID=173861 RepID=A0ABN1AZ95_9ACTN